MRERIEEGGDWVDGLRRGGGVHDVWMCVCVREKECACVFDRDSKG